MKNSCCGIPLRTADEIRAVRVDGVTCYETVRRTPGVATWKCDKCGRVYSQRLRQPKGGNGNA